MFSAASSTSTSALPEAPIPHRRYDDRSSPTANRSRYCVSPPIERLGPVLSRGRSDPRTAGDVRDTTRSVATMVRVQLFGPFKFRKVNGFMHLPALRAALDTYAERGVTPVDYNEEDAA